MINTNRIFTKSNFKASLFALAILLIISSIIYSQHILNAVQKQATDYISFRVRVFESNINNPNTIIDLNFFLNEVIQGADYPIIYTDANGKPISCRNINSRLDSLSNLSNLSFADSLFLYKQLEKISTDNLPIPITYQGFVLGYYYYGYSPVIYKLRIFPYLAIGAGVLFIVIGYIGFSYIKRSEERFIWIGMAKETAHQLGTPLTALSGWIELMKLDKDKLPIALLEMENDIQRLNKVANRFSKIGSIPELKNSDLNQLILNVVSYFQRRLPNLHKKIILTTDLHEIPSVSLNIYLFEWVLENLIKNCIDAIEQDNGQIQITTSLHNDFKNVIIDLMDNGRGIPANLKKDIFKPGFSTKTRGWGLGLSLARRIIVEYHQGKLFLKESRPFEKTVFRIILKI